MGTTLVRIGEGIFCHRLSVHARAGIDWDFAVLEEMDKDEARRQENHLLHDYFRVYGRLPPHNQVFH